jgi:long-chain acyl-CoA synthetase
VIVADNKEFLSLMDKSARETSDYDREVKDDDTAAIFFTSGTAATPKAVQLTHRNLLSNAESIMKFGKLSTRDCFISILPLHHTYSVTTTCVLPLALGGRISYPQMLSSKDILDCIKKTRVTVLVGVPQVFFLFHKEISEKLYALKDWQKKTISRVIDVLWNIRQRTGINLAKLFLSKLHRTFGRSLVFMISGGQSWTLK